MLWLTRDFGAMGDVGLVRATSLYVLKMLSHASPCMCVCDGGSCEFVPARLRLFTNEVERERERGSVCACV